MISVEEARQRLLKLASLMPVVSTPLPLAKGRFLAEDLIARRQQPAAHMSAMDGYAVRFSDCPGPWSVIGESAAGHRYNGALAAGEAVRIFTGAHLPENSDCVIIQEDIERSGDNISLCGDAPHQKWHHVRKAGSDFSNGDRLAQAGTQVNAGIIAAAAMAGYGDLPLFAGPRVAIISSGDELVPPGLPLRTEQIPSSNAVMIAAMLSSLPCEVQDLGIARDNLASLAEKLEQAKGADIIVTIGGASVGDHDLVHRAATDAGATMDFWRIAVRPGKPLMAGKLGNSVMLGLPGNPGSAFVTAFLFLLPLVRHMAGSAQPWPTSLSAPCTTAIAAGGPRAEYLRAVLQDGELTPFHMQDSGVTKPLASANALIIRPVDAPPVGVGDIVAYLPLDI
ncbi:molybdopterin molybdotransferase MoeA [Sphingorhabdus arenilitoris]|uniref:Molybdopterin molybdenumtransferase n=1 Tax=Sphingorhabdus arenilitoris TaxID=1490041 RepID=A0ABV8RI84_9SPHN